MATVEDLVIKREIAEVEENAQLHGWAFDRVGPNSFRVSLTAKNYDIFQLEVECDQFPDIPPAIHWRNQNSGALDELADSPDPYNYFHGSGRICAPGTGWRPQRAVRTKSGSGQTGGSSRKPRPPFRWLR